MKYLIYLIVLILSLVFYILYKYYKNDLFKDKITDIKNIILLLTSISYVFILSIDLGWLTFKLNRFNAITLILSLTLLIFSYGLIKNKKEIYNKNINYYMMFYLILLISLTIFIYRLEINLNIDRFISDISFSIKYYEPFVHTTKYYFIANLVMLIPLSILLIFKNDKYKNIFRQMVVIFITTIAIELLQVLTNTGSLDIDDIILNFSGSIIFVFLITRFKIVDYLKKLFYSDFNINKKIKYVLFSISLIIPILFNINTILITIKHIIK